MQEVYDNSSIHVTTVRVKIGVKYHRIIKAPPAWDPTCNHIKSLNQKIFTRLRHKMPEINVQKEIQLPITLDGRGEMHMKRKGSS